MLAKWAKFVVFPLLFLMTLANGLAPSDAILYVVFCSLSFAYLVHCIFIFVFFVPLFYSTRLLQAHLSRHVDSEDAETPRYVKEAGG